ncbi:MAG: tRNA (N6-isopentenyl adenosine(37)-C2)-methylthiotransferase MiaB [Candidatus Ancaeobacter aquaticus]|nr:tRNA (N6-isopentenyl adenosine(37)-C2)-methylthiotransferase MiaB [Candidatus Ancaeobacter aquaticus]
MPEKSKTYEKSAPRKVYIRTYGCQMNVSDTDVISGLLRQNGYSLVDDDATADIILFNTCSVRASAENKAIGKMREYGKIKDSRPELILGFCGCMAQKHKEELFKTMPALDFVCGTHAINKIPDLISQTSVNRKYLIDVSLTDEYPVEESGAQRTNKIKAFVPIMRGCDNYCSYCVVPYVRGKEVSRPKNDIINDIKRLAVEGYKEITLLGQNVNSYGMALKGELDSKFPQLLEKINNISGIERIRFVTSHPKDITDGLIELFGTLPKLCEYLHFPIQSGSDRILASMNRKYTVRHYMSIVEKLRRQCPDIALSTDIIVGYPSETEDDFQKTVEVMKAIEYDGSFIFKYSVREGTDAAKSTDDVPKEVKDERNQILLKLQEEMNIKKNEMLIGSDVEIMVEGKSPRNPNRMTGRTRTNKIAVFDAIDMYAPGELVNKKVKRVTALTLYC